MVAPELFGYFVFDATLPVQRHGAQDQDRIGQDKTNLSPCQWKAEANLV